MDGKIRLLKTNRTEFLVLRDDGQEFDALYREWCEMDDHVCNDELPVSCWVPIKEFLESRGVTVHTPEEKMDVLSEFYPG